ncbi:necdin-like 2 isoform X1 [Esox lucius]|uniref:MAGE domain-containing protein n=1 Tax=Esox lucius TaxID=8010 RepID=A0A3P9AIN7_ESOLU|nr:necdin-like 2 isoform X1 [Esox lucius]
MLSVVLTCSKLLTAASFRVELVSINSRAGGREATALYFQIAWESAPSVNVYTSSIRVSISGSLRRGRSFKTTIGSVTGLNIKAVMSQRKRPSNVQSSQSKGARHSEVLLGGGGGDDDDDDEDVTFTQPSTSQVQRGLARLTPAQVDLKTAEVVQFIFVKDQKKIPIRRADIVKHVVKDYRNIYPEIMKSVGRTLDTVFGLMLKEVDVKNHVYILINKLEPPGGELLNMTPSNPKIGLLFVILGIIFMKGGVVKESMVWNTLKKLRVDPGDRHEDFGDVKKVVTDEFVRQRYLEYVRIPHTEPLEFEFRWGQRADTEVSKVKLLEFMGQLHDQDPQSWTQQYRDATSSQTVPVSQR